MSTVVFLGDRFVDADSEATISLFDRGYLLGDGVFATMRGYDGICFRAKEHLAEITRGAELLGIELDPSRLDSLRANVNEAARRTGAANAYVRVTLTSGSGDGIGGSTLSIIARPMLDVPSPNDFENGIAAVTVKPRRIPPSCIDGTIKTTSYAVQVIARREVAERGAFEGVQLAIDGSLACGTMSTLFLIVGDELVTPGLETGCRAGITRAAVMSIAASKLGLTVREDAQLDPSTLFEKTTSEAFFASTRVECLPIATLDGKKIGAGAETVARNEDEGAGAGAGARNAGAGAETPTFARTHALHDAFVELVKKERERERRT